MKVWLIGILIGGFLGFTVSIMAYLLDLLRSGENSKHPLLLPVQLIIILGFGLLIWKAEGAKTLVGYILGSFYIVRLILLPDKLKIK